LNISDDLDHKTIFEPRRKWCNFQNFIINKIYVKSCVIARTQCNQSCGVENTQPAINLIERDAEKKTCFLINQSS